MAQSEAQRAEGVNRQSLGVWRLNKEPDGLTSISLFSPSGRAISTVNGAQRENGEPTKEASSASGRTDGSIKSNAVPQAGRSARGSGSESSAPADLSLATRVGEARFSVEP